MLGLPEADSRVWRSLPSDSPGVAGGDVAAPASESRAARGPMQLPWGYPWSELVAAAVAAVIALFVTHVQKLHQKDRPMNRSMEQAQVLLAVAGALIMIIIGSSLARAFGIAGAAGIMRFRTPVEDPKDVTVLFLLMGLGMACGIGALPIAALGGLFLAVSIVVLDMIVAVKPRVMRRGDDREGPRVSARPRRERVCDSTASPGSRVEFTQGEAAEMTYRTTLPPHVSIDEVTEALVAGGAHGLDSVSWEPPKQS